MTLDAGFSILDEELNRPTFSIEYRETSIQYHAVTAANSPMTGDLLPDHRENVTL